MARAGAACCSTGAGNGQEDRRHQAVQGDGGGAPAYEVGCRRACYERALPFFHVAHSTFQSP